MVTAQKREQRLQDVPVAVTAVGRDAIERQEINNVQDLSKAVPSLRFTTDAYTATAVNVRGVGTNVYSIAVEPNVSVMLDGVALARSSMVNFDFADLERVEVLRGPQGTLFGKNASAGLVHVITRDPGDEFEARVRASYEKPLDTDGDFTKLQATVGGPLAEVLAGRISVYAKRRNGHLRNVYTSKDSPDSEQWGARAKLRWDISDSFAARLALEFSRKDGEAGLITFRSGSPTLQDRSRPIEFREENREARAFPENLADGEGKAVTLTLDWDLGEHTLTSVTGIRSADNFDNITVFGLDGQRAHLRHNFTTATIDTFTQELRLSSANSETLEYTVGALWFANELTEDYDRAITDLSAAIIAGTVAPGGLLPPGLGDGLGGVDAVDQIDTRDAAVDIDNLGIFAEATWHIGDRWHLTAGARYIDETVDIALATTSTLAQSSTGQPLTEEEFPETKTSVSDQTITGKLALMFDLNEGNNLYATFATGYRGSAFDVAGADPQAALDNPVEPEKATSFEFGYKARLFDQRLELNTALFHTRFEDFQAQIRDLTNTGSIVSHRLDNAGALETSGVEIEFKARPHPQWLISGSFLYNKAIYKEFITQCFAGQGPNEGGAIDEGNDGSCDAQDVAGGRLANAPEYSASILGRYDLMIDGANRGYAQLSGRWQDKIQFTNEQQPSTIADAYSIWDLRVAALSRDNRFEAALYIKNLFDQVYTNNLIPLTLANDRRDVVHNLSMDATRTAGISLSYSW